MTRRSDPRAVLKCRPLPWTELAYCTELSMAFVEVCTTWTGRRDTESLVALRKCDAIVSLATATMAVNFLLPGSAQKCQGEKEYHRVEISDLVPWQPWGGHAPPQETRADSRTALLTRVWPILCLPRVTICRLYRKYVGSVFVNGGSSSYVYRVRSA